MHRSAETIDEIKGTMEAAENLAALHTEQEKAEETTSPYQRKASASRAAVLAHKRYNNLVSSAAKLKKQWCVVCDQIVQVSVPQVTEPFGARLADVPVPRSLKENSQGERSLSS